MIMNIYITHKSFFMLPVVHFSLHLICFVTIDYFAFSRILYQWINKVQIILFFQLIWRGTVILRFICTAVCIDG